MSSPREVKESLTLSTKQLSDRVLSRILCDKSVMFLALHMPRAVIIIDNNHCDEKVGKSLFVPLCERGM